MVEGKGGGEEECRSKQAATSPMDGETSVHLLPEQTGKRQQTADRQTDRTTKQTPDRSKATQKRGISARPETRRARRGDGSPGGEGEAGGKRNQQVTKQQVTASSSRQQLSR